MVMNKLNNRGYVLIEIILASVIAFAIAYYMLDLTLKLKNKNDDLLAETLVKTDQAIIQNKLVQYMKEDKTNFSCDGISIDGKVISYKGNLIDIINEYTVVGSKACSISNNIVNINIPLTVGPLNKSFNVEINYVLK